MVPVPQADMLVRRAAALFEPTSPTSTLPPELIAAHVSLLSPFLPPPLVDDAVVDTLSAICAQNARHAFFAEPFLPIHAEAGEVQLLAVRGQTWQLVHRFELA